MSLHAPPHAPADDFHEPTAVLPGAASPSQVRACRLTTLHGGRRCERIFDQPEVAIGSLADNDLVLADPTVSRHHCRIARQAHGWVLLDLGSTNGSFVDRVRVREALLHPGCTVRVGAVELAFDAPGEAPAPRDSGRPGIAATRSARMQELFVLVEKIAPTGATVVIEGETGTGKEVIAREIHRLSPRAQAPLMVLDCGAVPPGLIESELFGHERGAFTGAVAARPGLFELARGGTLFLDELGELPLDLQPRLLRALEAREVRRVGGSRPLRVDARIVAATHRDLEEEVASGRFREDLFYRLSVVRLHVPPLRERLEDLPLLVDHLLARRGSRLPGGAPRIRRVSAAAMERLAAHRWPGNVRELANAIERAASLSDGDVLDADALPVSVAAAQPAPGPLFPDGGGPLPGSDGAFPGGGGALPGGGGALPGGGGPRLAGGAPFKEARGRLLSSFERDYVEGVLRRTGGNISRAAREADVDRKYFRRLMRKHSVGGTGP